MTLSAPRLKWHKLRRRLADPPFLRENLFAALDVGAACEVDVVLTADGHPLCLHDLTLDRETTGRGLASAALRREIEELRQRAEDGTVLDSRPLFLDEVVAAVQDTDSVAPGLVQLDLKLPPAELDARALKRIAATLGGEAAAFIVSGTDWNTVTGIAEAVPGVQRGFDPLAFYPRRLGLDADGYRALGEKAFAIAPSADVFYLEARLVLAALDVGVNLVEAVTGRGALVDAWTVDPAFPELRAALRRLLVAGCGQITTNDPEALGQVIADILAEGTEGA